MNIFSVFAYGSATVCESRKMDIGVYKQRSQSIGGVSDTLTELNNAVSTRFSPPGTGPDAPRSPLREYEPWEPTNRSHPVLLDRSKQQRSVSGFHIYSSVIVPFVSLRTAIPLRFHRSSPQRMDFDHGRDTEGDGTRETISMWCPFITIQPFA